MTVHTKTKEYHSIYFERIKKCNPKYEAIKKSDIIKRYNEGFVLCVLEKLKMEYD